MKQEAIEKVRLQEAERAAAQARRDDLAGRVREEVNFRNSLSAQPVAAELKLSWEVLPPGHWERRASSIVAPSNASPAGRLEPERLRLLQTLSPHAWYQGSCLGRTVYLVAVFDSIAIAGSPDWGNALYYCPADRWQSIFRMGKQRALAGGAHRIFHTDGWEERVLRLVEGKRAVEGAV